MKNPVFTFKKSDTGIQGKAFEMAIKAALKKDDAFKVSPCGVSDFKYQHRNYDAKSNGTVLQYHEGQRYIKGSNRVIYTTHVSYKIVREENDTITIEVDLADTSLFVLDRQEFLDYLASVNKLKYNAQRGQVNVQTAYNYKKDCYHGAWGKKFETWAFEHELEDDIIDKILSNLDY